MFQLLEIARQILTSSLEATHALLTELAIAAPDVDHRGSRRSQSRRRPSDPD